MSVIDLSESRVTLVSALAWRAIAELARRHSARYRFRVRQFHPGISMHGVIQLRLSERHTQRDAGWIDFNLGGPAGSYSSDRGDGCITLAGLLGEQPVEVINAIEADLGLEHPSGTLPPSMPQDLALRLVAGLLERQVFEPVPWRASLAVHGWNGDTHVSPWHQRVLGDAVSIVEETGLSQDDHDRLSDLVIVHASAHGMRFDDDRDPHRRAVVVDLSTSQVLMLDAKGARLLGESAALYAAHGRSMRNVVAAIEVELHR